MSEERGFKLNQLKLDFVLSKVPKGVPISVISVVGAFRTGKSFLLDLFLRYLRHSAATARVAGHADGCSPLGAAADAGEIRGAAAEWLRHDGGHLEGNVSAGASDFARPVGGVGVGAGPVSKKVGFKWRYGNDRQTTGMWLWSEPFIRALPNGGGKVAVLLMDTQGLFDSKVAQMLTTQIFGLSTLLSSYQIFNVCPRLTENELQNVAVFAEFARIAATGANAGVGSGGAEGEEGGGGGDIDDAVKAKAVANSQTPLPPSPTATATTTATAPAAPNKRGVARAASLLELMRGSGGTSTAPQPVFQRLEFLVRDSVLRYLTAGADAADTEMATYIRTIFGNAAHEDLRVVREQILTVFEHTSCFLLPHPGHVVTEDADFDGNIDSIRPEFLALLDRYVRIVFTEQLEPKVACGRALSAGDFGAFVHAYAAAFSDTTKFPEARVLFDATTDANNRSAADAALCAFHKLIAERTAHSTAFLDDALLKTALAEATETALALFTVMASFGPPRAIRLARLGLEANIGELSRDATAQNDALGAPGKATAAAALVPLLFILWIVRVTLDFVCSPFLDICKRSSVAVSFGWFLLFAFVAYKLYQVGSQSALGVARVITRSVETLSALANVSFEAAGGRGAGAAALAAGSAAVAAPSAPHLVMPAARPNVIAIDSDAGLRRRRGT